MSRKKIQKFKYDRFCAQLSSNRPQFLRRWLVSAAIPPPRSYFCCLVCPGRSAGTPESRGTPPRAPQFLGLCGLTARAPVRAPRDCEPTGLQPPRRCETLCPTLLVLRAHARHAAAAAARCCRRRCLPPPSHPLMSGALTSSLPLLRRRCGRASVPRCRARSTASPRVRDSPTAWRLPEAGGGGVAERRVRHEDACSSREETLPTRMHASISEASRHGGQTTCPPVTTCCAFVCTHTRTPAHTRRTPQLS